MIMIHELSKFKNEIKNMIWIFAKIQIFDAFVVFIWNWTVKIDK